MPESEAKISVCIPVYNREKYIEHCCISLFEQTYDNLEYIFVDDGSTDRSVEIIKNILQQYPGRAKQVSIIQCDRNYGLWHSRNLSLSKASGKYVMVCDADDWIELDAVRLLTGIAAKSGADIVCTPYYENHDKVISFASDDYKNINKCKIDALHFSWCNKLIRRDLLVENDWAVPEGLNCWEDVSVTARLLALTDKIILSDTPFYHYRKENQESFTYQDHKKILKEHLFCAKYLDNWFRNRGDDFYNRYTDFLNALKFTAKIKMLRGKRDFKNWKELYPEVNSDLNRYKWLPVHYRILFYLADKLPLKLLNLFS